jgi:pimeloyl-ACP methyl ester carboxylesterase
MMAWAERVVPKPIRAPVVDQLMRDRSHRKTDPESFLSLVPHARIVRLAESGHCPHVEDPDAFFAALKSSKCASPRI